MNYLCSNWYKIKFDEEHCQVISVKVVIVIMSYFEILPTDVQSYIMDIKYNLETKDLQAFSDNFVMCVVSIKRVSTSKHDLRVYHRYNSVIHLTYKPTNKSIITHYGYGAYEGNDNLPSKMYVVHGICFDAHYYKHGDWIYYKDTHDRWQKDWSYERYCENEEGTNMTFKQFIRWKVQVKKTELMLGNAFEKFLLCYDEL
jgi:hypothetical protein